MADNDKKIIKIIKQIIRTSIFRISYLDKKVFTAEQGNNLLYSALLEGKPFAAVRFGAVEARCVSSWLSGSKYTDYDYVAIKDAAGFFPSEREYMDQFCKLYMDKVKKADILAVWGVRNEKKFVNEFCPNATLIEAMSLEPYFCIKPWSKALENKKVLIIHPFVKSISKQLRNNREKIFVSQEVLPLFKKVEYVKAVQSNAGEKPGYATWFEALESMKNKIDKADYDVAIIGAGAYGLPLAIYCKEKGKMAIQMAGATQILFGIKGKRWENRKKYKALINEYWIKASKEETPKEKNKVEGGSYW